MTDTYFQHPNMILCIFIIILVTVTHLGYFRPELVPDGYLGPIGLVYRYISYEKPWLIQIIYHLALAIHFIEACYSIILTKKKGILDLKTRIKWFVSTFVFGAGSLYHLITYNGKQSFE